jgi:hypothetical protein
MDQPSMPPMQGNGKPRKGKNWQTPPGEGPGQQMLPPPPPQQQDEGAAHGQPPMSGEMPPGGQHGNGKPKGKKDRGKGQGAQCPEGTVLLEDGSCVPTQ